MANEFRYTAAFEQARRAGISSLPGHLGSGDPGRDAGRGARNGVGLLARAYLESLRKDGEPLPYEAPERTITERLTVELASV
jgi:hypothetical protein